MTKVVLYSGGLDSYIGYWLLHREDPEWIPVYFDLKTRYSWKELQHMPDVGAIRARAIRDMLDLSTIEQDDGYVPQRNTLLCATAHAVYNAPDIALCSVADDVYADNDISFHLHMSWLLSHTAEHQVNVFSPLMKPKADNIFGIRPLLTKAEAVALYLTEGGDTNALRQTVSCYDPVEVSCGHCTACVRRRDALEANGIRL